PKLRRSVMADLGSVIFDLGVAGLSYLANSLWLLGYPDQALTWNRAALTLAQETAHPVTTVIVWCYNTLLHQCLHEARTVQQQAEALITLCNEQGFLELSTWGIVPHGWVLAMQGQEEDGIKQIQQGLAIARTTGGELLRPYFLALLAEA